MAVSLKIKRGTRAQIDSAAASGQLHAGELYLITDEDRIAVGLSATAYSSHARELEAASDGGLVTVATAAPATPVEGQEWLDENDGHLYVYMQGFWVQSTRPGPQGGQGIQGIQGIQGEQGIQGDQGDPGADGADAVFTFCQVRNTDTATDINAASWANIPFGGMVDASHADFTTGSDSITCNFTGTVSVNAAISQTGAVVRSSVGIRISKNGAHASGIGLSGYIRAVNSHEESSSHISATFVVASGDVIRVEGLAYGEVGTVTQLAGASQVTVERRA